MRRLLLLVVVLGGCDLLGTAPEPVPTVTVVEDVFTREVVAEGNLRPVDATQLTAPRDARGAMKIAWVIADGAAVEEGELVVRFDDTDAEKQRLDGEADLESAQKALEKERLQSQQAIRQRERTADLAGEELKTTEQFQSKDVEIYSRNQIAKSRIDSELAKARLSHADTSRTIEERLSRSKLELLQLAVDKAQLDIDRAEKMLEQLEVRAPHAGVVVLKQGRRGGVSTVGDTVWPGHRLAELPQLDQLEAEVYVLEADAAGLAEALPAVVGLDARPGVTFEATISKVDKLAKPRQRGVPLQYFEVILDLATVDPELMKPGQRVTSTLSLGGEDALILPRQAIFERDGETIAWRKNGEEFEPAPLTLGVSSPGRVTVKEGLAAGDVVAVRDPTRTISGSDEDSGTAGSGLGSP
ncbi:MAG: efflux RND transporter periplasmic adaptor subunit [Deltaproteobacteria bacterium]|nr:efflux RND transporter periplasmic adaptor subunit [Deltaproteobacteria bacterium]